MGDVIDKNIFEPYGPYGKAVLVQLEKTREILIGAEVFKIAYEEAIRKWRRKVGYLFSLASATISDSTPNDDLIDGLQELAAEMDQTVKQ